MLLLALALAAQPAPPSRAVATVRASARIVRPARVLGGRTDAREVTQVRMRPGLMLIEFQ